jgi:WD40 repeat protein
MFFASGSDDGSVKIWDCQRLEKNIANRSRLTYSSQGMIQLLIDLISLNPKKKDQTSF